MSLSKFYVPSFNGSLVVAIKPKAYYKFYASAITWIRILKNVVIWVVDFSMMYYYTSIYEISSVWNLIYYSCWVYMNTCFCLICDFKDDILCPIIDFIVLELSFLKFDSTWSACIRIRLWLYGIWSLKSAWPLSARPHVCGVVNVCFNSHRWFMLHLAYMPCLALVLVSVNRD
jgi:hypothetical protein